MLMALVLRIGKPLHTEIMSHTLNLEILAPANSYKHMMAPPESKLPFGLINYFQTLRGANNSFNASNLSQRDTSLMRVVVTFTLAGC